MHAGRPRADDQGVSQWEQEFERIDLDALSHDARALVLDLVEQWRSEDAEAEQRDVREPAAA